MGGKKFDIIIFDVMLAFLPDILRYQAVNQARQSLNDDGELWITENIDQPGKITIKCLRYQVFMISKINLYMI